MHPRVKAIKPDPDYTITLWFTNGEVRRFDVKPYLDKGFFQELKEISAFNTVKPFLGSVQWKNGQDFCPDTLYEDSAPIMDKVERAGARASRSQTTALRPRTPVRPRQSSKVSGGVSGKEV